jgi:hypothetical protein
VILNGLVSDSGKDVHTLRTFKDQILTWKWLQPEKKECLTATLLECDFDPAVETIRCRVRVIRTNLIAHRLIDKQTGNPKKEIPRVYLDELWALFRAANRLFGALSFGEFYQTLAGDFAPAPEWLEATRNSLDRALDAIVRESPIVNMPERNPDVWRIRKRNLPQGYLATMNLVRKRIDLPEA